MLLVVIAAGRVVVSAVEVALGVLITGYCMSSWKNGITIQLAENFVCNRLGMLLVTLLRMLVSQLRSLESLCNRLLASLQRILASLADVGVTNKNLPVIKI